MVIVLIILSNFIRKRNTRRTCQRKPYRTRH